MVEISVRDCAQIIAVAVFEASNLLSDKWSETVI